VTAIAAVIAFGLIIWFVIRAIGKRRRMDDGTSVA